MAKTQHEHDGFRYFGRDERWYSQLVAFCQTYLPSVRDTQLEKDYPELSEDQDVESAVFPAAILDHISGLEKPEDIFAFLQLPVDKENAAAFESRGTAWLLEYAQQHGSEKLPLITLAIVYSAQSANENLGWLGQRVGTIFAEYFAALETIYRAKQGETIPDQELDDAKTHRDGIEFFCSQLFGDDLKQIREVLAQRDSSFLYNWEELNGSGEIVMRDLSKTRQSSQSAE